MIFCKLEKRIESHQVLAVVILHVDHSEHLMQVAHEVYNHLGIHQSYQFS